MRLKDKVAIVTGASGGMGAEECEERLPNGKRAIPSCRYGEEVVEEGIVKVFRWSSIIPKGALLKSLTLRGIRIK